MLAAEGEDEMATRRSRSAKSMDRRDRGNPLATPPSVLGTLWGELSEKTGK